MILSLINLYVFFFNSRRDLFANIVCTLADIRFEIVCVLYNIGALHCKLGAEETRTTPDSMKAACTHFQSAAWAFQYLREHYPQPSGIDLSPEVMKLFQDICLAQAQECILEKSMLDNRKPSIVSKYFSILLLQLWVGLGVRVNLYSIQPL